MAEEKKDYYRLYLESLNGFDRIIIVVKNGDIVRTFSPSGKYLVKFERISKYDEDLEGKIN